MNRYEIETAIKDYKWMMESIKIFRQALEDRDSILIKVTAQYGEETIMPKPQGETSDPVYREALRRERYWKRVAGYEKKVKAVQEKVHLIKEEREAEVLHWLLEGESYSWIARHMGLSERHIRRIKDSIVDKMSKMPNSPKTSKKCAC